MASVSSTSRPIAPSYTVHVLQPSQTTVEATLSVPWQPGHEGQDNRDGYQNNDNPLQDFHALGSRPIRDFLIDAFQGVQFADDTGVPLCKMKTLRYQSIHPGQILITKEFEGVIDPFKKHGAI